MATKTANTKNPERKGAEGRAWKKSHGAPAKVLSPEAQARKAEKEARRNKIVRPGGGSNITMPRISWEWAGQTMAARWPNTRRVRMVDACIARGRGRDDDGGIPVIETNPEAKPASRRNGR